MLSRVKCTHIPTECSRVSPSGNGAFGFDVEDGRVDADRFRLVVKNDAGAEL